MAEKISWIYFLRHAESESNAGMEVQQHTKETELSVRGEKQAREVIKVLKKEKFDLVIVSPFQRAQDTIKPFLDSHGKKIPTVIWPVQEFVYHSLGKKIKNSHDKKIATARKYWLAADPDYRESVGGETYREFISRIEQVCQRLIRSKYKKILVVSHGHFTKHLIWRLLHPTLQISKEIMADARDFTRAMKMKNTAVIKIAKIDGKLYVGEINSRHVKSS